jgi:hypothetical protein
MSNDLIDEAYGYPDDSPKCKACGVKMIDHLGLLGTCRELWNCKEIIGKLTDRIKELESKIEDLEAQNYNFMERQE